MRAVVCRGPRDYVLEDRQVPSVGKGDVLLAVEACGICAGDVKARDGAAMFWGDDVQPAWMTAPVIPGHEFIGRVVEIGAEARSRRQLTEGDRVVVEQIVPCGECRYCRRGQYWMCQVHDIYGFKSHLDGGMAEFVRVPEKALTYKVPRDFPTVSGVMVEPLACAIHAVERADIELGQVVVIAGLGALGLCMIQVARLKTPALLIGIDTNPFRLHRAQALGAQVVLNPREQDVVAEVMSLTGGYGCDRYIEATGAPAGVVQGLKMIRKLGVMVEFSVFEVPTTVDWSIIGDRKELDIHGAHLSPYTFQLAIDYLASGVVKAEPLVTHKLPLEQFEQGFDLVHRAQDSIKVTLWPTS
ncbi:MAG: alcohol dehydrogenase catalytic domain-containing protein [Bacillota bacterium]|nr:alcohol dehydrogenase catalytic domain-containing protein [Bacillota bacterium]